MAWNVGELGDMVLPPCHFGFQCYTNNMTLTERKKWWVESLGKDISYADDVTENFLDEKNVPKRKLSLKWFQRSVDSPLGLPFNIASYAILLHLLAKEVNMVPHLLKFNGGDCHIYTNQIDGVKEQLQSETYKLPKIKLHNKSIDDLKYEDIEIVDYDERIKTIKFPLSN
jgi:thymidylate synthase